MLVPLSLVNSTLSSNPYQAPPWITQLDEQPLLLISHHLEISSFTTLACKLRGRWTTQLDEQPLLLVSPHLEISSSFTTHQACCFTSSWDFFFFHHSPSMLFHLILKFLLLSPLTKHVVSPRLEISSSFTTHQAATRMHRKELMNHTTRRTADRFFSLSLVHSTSFPSKSFTKQQLTHIVMGGESRKSTKGCSYKCRYLLENFFFFFHHA